MIGGSCKGSPTAISLRQLNLAIGRRLYGSSICEHSSRITILNYIFFITSKLVAAQVAPTTRFEVRASILAYIDFSFMHLILFCIDLASSYYAAVMFYPGLIDILNSSIIPSNSFNASLSAYFLFDAEWWVYGNNALLIFFSDPIRAKSSKLELLSIRSILSTATFVSAQTNILVSVSPS